MKKQSIDDLRKEYRRLIATEPAIRWNRQTLEKKITEHEVLAAHYAAKDGAMKKQADPAEPNPEFEQLAASVTQNPDETTHARDLESPETPTTEPVGPGRGGQREGAGRPVGQSDSRARCERVMALEVPDLAVGIGVDALNTGLARVTGVGIDDKAIASEALAKLPHGSASLALGLTKLLYYWCPSLEGRTDVVTLHLEALFLIVNPFRERGEKIAELIRLKKEQDQHGKEEQSQVPAPAPAVAPAAAPVEPTGQKPPPKVRAKGKRRR